MSATREALITLNQTTNCTGALTNIMEFVTAVARLNASKLFRDTKPRLNSTYRHFDTLPESILDPRDVKSFKDFIIKFEFTGGCLEKTVLSVNDFAVLDEDARKKTRSDKQAIITNSDAGRDYWIEMLKVETAFSAMDRRLPLQGVFETYRLFRLGGSLRDTRHLFYTTDCVSAETYARAFILYTDTVSSNDMIVSDTNSLSHRRPGSVHPSRFESEKQVAELERTLLTAKQVTGCHCVFSSEQMKEKKAHKELIDFVESLSAE